MVLRFSLSFCTALVFVVVFDGPVFSRVLQDESSDLDFEAESHVIRKRQAPANGTAEELMKAQRQMVRALMSQNTLTQVLRRLQSINSPNVSIAQGELDKLIASQKGIPGMFDIITKLKAQEGNEDVEKLKVDIFLEDYGGVTKDVGKIAAQIVKIETVESQLAKLPFNMGLEYLVATLTNIKPLLLKYRLWDPITKAKEQLKVTTRAG